MGDSEMIGLSDEKHLPETDWPPEDEVSCGTAVRVP
jgi:hypothetical protein